MSVHRAPPFALLQSERLSRNASALDSEQAKRTAAQLANATAHTTKYYGSDVRVAYLLTQGLLQHESRQQGFNLTATKDVHFTEVPPPPTPLSLPPGCGCAFTT